MKSEIDHNPIRRYHFGGPLAVCLYSVDSTGIVPADKQRAARTGHTQREGFTDDTRAEVPIVSPVGRQLPDTTTRLSSGQYRARLCDGQTAELAEIDAVTPTFPDHATVS